jgi:hypothetical protein
MVQYRLADFTSVASAKVNPYLTPAQRKALNLFDSNQFTSYHLNVGFGNGGKRFRAGVA